ncbi:MAG: MBL fold metallo-hydrolase [Acidobacteria bacterium]|nr:MBL fold metallo-hydrolase [Acidobacteriota bacterium]
MLAWFSVAPRASAQSCPGTGVAVQILGSGGPRINRDRASAGYLVWIDGRSRMLVDAGGGAFLRFGEANARMEDLSLIAISHLHPDHVSDLPALLWGDAARTAPLAISGPSGNDAVPGFPTFLTHLFDQKSGAFQVLAGTLGGSSGRGVPLEVAVVDVTKKDASTVLSQQDLAVTAISIPHSNIPALAYRVRAQNATIVFSTDQTGADPRFVDFARGADVLVMHLAIAAGTTSPLHAAPDVVGRVARDAQARRLVLSHIGQFDLGPAVADVKKYYPGPLTVGADLQCTPVGPAYTSVARSSRRSRR